VDAVEHPARTSRTAGTARALPILVFLGSFTVFLGSPNHQMTDSGYALLVSENLIRHGDLDLERYQLESVPGSNYRLERTGAHTTYFFPVASSILSIPFVALGHLAGQSVVRPNGTYATKVEGRQEAILAALLMAAFTVIAFCTARLVLPVSSSLAIALVGAFGTQVYSTASRTLWSDTWALVLVAGAIYLLVRSAVRGDGRRLFWLATLECWATFVRPTSGLTLAATAFYLLIVDRRASWAFFAAAALWLTAFVADALHRFGTPFPSYFHDRLGPPSGEALLGTLMSPSRGLLVCVPATLAVVWICWRHRKALRFVPLLRMAASVCLAHWLVISAFDKWWGGHCFGARLATGMVPWLLVLAILGLDGARRDLPGATTSRRYVSAAVVALLCGLSIAINSAGAISARAVGWNLTPTNIDLDTARLWSWHHPQTLAGLGEPTPSDPIAPTPGR